MEQLAKDLALLSLPSPVWGTHIHLEFKFIAILHVNISSDVIAVDKGIVLVEGDDKLRLKVFLNGFVSQIPNINYDVSVSDLSGLLGILHNRNVCVNAADNSQNPECLKLVENDSNDGDSMKYCRACRNKSKAVASGRSREYPPCKNSCRYDEGKNENEQNSTKLLESNLIAASECCQGSEQVKSQIDKEERTDKCTTVNGGLCNVCGKTFPTHYRIDEHMLTHTLQKKYQCKVCKRAFAKNCNLKRHEYIHSGERPYLCSACGKTYTTGSNLSAHTFSCHKKKKRHACEICEMTFVYPRYLKLHMRKHTGERPYACEMCGKKFSKNIHLTVHMRTHTGEKPYCCTICGKCFTTTGGLGSHKKAHHLVN